MKDAYRIVKTHALTPRQTLEAEQLAQVCRERDGLAELPLFMEPAQTADESNQILCYEGEALIGFISLFSLAPADEIEAVGMTHPDHRRKGAGRALVEATKAECRLRGGDTFLLVCLGAFPVGAIFAETIGGTYRFSEYRMELNPALFTPYTPQNEALLLQSADVQDLDGLASIQAAAFGSGEEEGRRTLAN